VNLATDNYSHRILAALFNGLYQGLALTIVVWLGLKLFRHLNAATRHLAYLTTLLLVAALPVVHMFLAIGDHPNAPVAKNESAATNARANAVGKQSSEGATLREQEHKHAKLQQDEVIKETPASDWPRQSHNKQSSFGQTRGNTGAGMQTWVSSAPTAGAERQPINSSVGLPLHLEPVTITLNNSRPPASSQSSEVWSSEEEIISQELAGSSPSTWLRRYPAELPSKASLIALSILVTISGIRVVWLIGRCVLLLQLKKRGLPVGPSWDHMRARIGNELRIRRSVQVREGDGINSPIAIGFLRPMILLPKGFVTGTAPAEVESILRHELAHVRRYDDWTNLFQQFVVAAMFFHPAVLWLSRRLTIEREIACDDHVVASAGSPRDYALLLAEFAGRTCGHDWATAPAAWRSESQLKERIHMLLDSKRNASTRLAATRTGLLTTAAIAMAALAVIAGPRLVLAEPSVRATISPDIAPTVVVEPAPDIAVVAPVEVSTLATVVAPRPAITPLSRPTVRLVQTAPLAPKPPAAPKPGRQPAPGDPSLPPAKDPTDESLEQRVQHLEDLVHSLLKGQADANILMPPAAVAFGPDGSETARLKEQLAMAERQVHQVQLEKHEWQLSEKDQAKIAEDMKRAEKEIAKAAKDAERTMHEAHPRWKPWPSQPKQPGADPAGNANNNEDGQINQERHAIEQQREAVEHQMQQLEQHLNKLEEQLERLNEQEERSNEVNEADHEEETGPVPAAAPTEGLLKP
jgi:beta-lactamase regulating signal transducer with metallopeptidase domain